MRDSEAVIK